MTFETYVNAFVIVFRYPLIIAFCGSPLLLTAIGVYEDNGEYIFLAMTSQLLIILSFYLGWFK